MAASMYRTKVFCNHRIKIGRFYYSSIIDMAYRSVYNVSTSLNVTSNTKLRLGRMEQDFKNGKFFISSTKSMHRQSVNCFHMGINCDVRKAPQSRNYQTRNPNITVISRWYSDDTGPPRKMFPNIMEFPEIVWPSIIKTLRNWILANLIIRPYFDQEFGLPDFILGSKQAVEHVSGCISRGDYAAMENMVTPEALEEVKMSMSTFTLHQRQELALSKEDIYFSFPYQIGVMFNDDDKNQQRFVEITMCYHVLKGLKELSEQGIKPPLNMGMLPEYRDKIYICNYRFIREFTKGVDDQWTVNIVNHFKPSDYTI